MITTVMFNGQNYDLWDRAVTTALKAKNKLGFIKGKITRREEQEVEDFFRMPCMGHG